MPETISAEKLESWGKQVAGEFVQDRTRLMTPAIEKIASDNKLNREQIQRICEFANHEANEKIIKTASEKTEEFQLADINEITKNVKGIPEPAVKEASFDFSKLASYKPITEVPLDLFFSRQEKIAAAKDAMTKVAGRKMSDNDKAGCLLKLAAMKDQLKLKAIEYESDNYAIKQAMAGIIKDLIDDGHKFEDLYKAAAASKPGNADSIRLLFDEIGQDLVKKGHIMNYKLASDRLYLKAAQIVKKASINPEDHDVKYLQKKHQLELKIGEYFECGRNSDLTLKATDYVDDKITKVREKIRGEKPTKKE